MNLKTGDSIKIWLDDIRDVPSGYIGTKSVNETIDLIKHCIKNDINILLLDLDHDLGDYSKDGGDAIFLLDYLVENKLFYEIKIHTANPVGRANMERLIRRFWP